MKKYMNINDVITSMRDARRAIVRGINAQSEIEQLDCAYTASARYFEVLYALYNGLEEYKQSEINDAFLKLVFSEYEYEEVRILKERMGDMIRPPYSDLHDEESNPCIAVYALERTILRQIDIDAEVSRIIGNAKEDSMDQIENKNIDKIAWNKDRFDFYNLNKNINNEDR